MVHGGHDFQQILRCLGVQRPGGFVSQEQGLARNHCSGAGSPLLLAPGNLIRKFRQDVGDAQLSSHLPHPVLYCSGVLVIQREGQTDVFLDGQGIQQIEVLEHKAQPLPAELGQFTFRQVGHAHPVQENFPGADGVNGGNAVEQGGLA